MQRVEHQDRPSLYNSQVMPPMVIVLCAAFAEEAPYDEGLWVVAPAGECNDVVGAAELCERVILGIGLQ